jgi:hypothetical protein
LSTEAVSSSRSSADCTAKAWVRSERAPPVQSSSRGRPFHRSQSGSETRSRYVPEADTSERSSRSSPGTATCSNTRTGQPRPQPIVLAAAAASSTPSNSEIPWRTLCVRVPKSTPWSVSYPARPTDPQRQVAVLEGTPSSLEGEGRPTSSKRSLVASRPPALLVPGSCTFSSRDRRHAPRLDYADGCCHQRRVAHMPCLAAGRIRS